MRHLVAGLLAMVFFVSTAVPATVPRKAVEFGFELPGGKQVLLSQYRGKAVVLAFFSTTCPHCQNTSMTLQRLQNEFGPQGLQVLGVCFNDMAKLLTPEFVQKYRLTYPVGYSLPQPVLDYMQHPMTQVPYVPMIMFIDKQGMIRAQFGGDADFFKNEEVNMRKNILTILGKPGAAAAPASAPAAVAKPAGKKAS